MTLRVAIVGPGRVGRAFGRRLVQPRVDLLGFVGRTAAAATAAATWCGAGRALQLAELGAAHVVMFTVGDADLPGTVAAALAAAPPRPCALWLHTSGRCGLEVFAAAVPRGIRCGALHPVAPFPDAATGLTTMQGAPAVLLGDARSERLLLRLCELLGLVPVLSRGGDRVLYHAACVLAANGLTVLRGLVDDVFAAAGGLSRPDAGRLAFALMGAALRTSSEQGAAAALSGPVLRGDAATLRAHLQALGGAVPAAIPSYLALMRGAVDLAVARGLDASAAAALRSALLPGAACVRAPDGD